MNRFNLETLPLCGAKTRSGNPCKRRGNKSNGRCKLHGGNSTGPKTEVGKINSSKNSLPHYWLWVLGKKIDRDMLNRAYRALYQLKNIEIENEADLESFMLILEKYHVDLEAVKWGILKLINEDSFILIQGALDRYYSEIGHSHMYVHQRKDTLFTGCFTNLRVSLGK